jgi:phenylacetate-CoA ligase
VREILFGLPHLAPSISTFKLISLEDEHHNKRMEVAVELVSGAKKPNEAAAAKEVFEKLGKMNGDFYNAMNHTATPENMPELKFYGFGKGPFEGGQKKLKNEYVVSKLKYDAL